MRKLFLAIAAISCAAAAFTSCKDNNNWSAYEEWRKVNNEWYAEQMARKHPDGSNYYTVVQPDWYPRSGVLIHYFNDRSLTQGNLQPMITSKVTVKYHGRLYDDSCFDSTSTGSDSVRTFTLSSTIVGWQIALTQMHVGDSCEIILPYAQAYDTQGSTSSSGVYTIPPYSALRFNIGLKAVPDYEIP